MKLMKVKLMFMEDILGTSGADPEIHETYIASKTPNALTDPIE